MSKKELIVTTNTANQAGDLIDWLLEQDIMVANSSKKSEDGDVIEWSVTPAYRDTDQEQWNEFVQAAVADLERGGMKVKVKKSYYKKKGAADSSAPKAPSKKDQAREIFAQMKGAARKDVIQAFIDNLNMTKAGASTYYQSLKNE